MFYISKLHFFKKKNLIYLCSWWIFCNFAAKFLFIKKHHI